MCNLVWAALAGTSDLIGYRKVTITPEMVGTEVPCLRSWQWRSRLPRGRATEQQKAFIEHIRNAGGMQGWLDRLTKQNPYC